VRFFALLLWVFALSWLTHEAASPSWRSPDTVAVFINPTQAAELSEWEVKPASTTIVAAPGPSMALNPDNDKWGRAVRTITVAPSENLYRLKATLSTDGDPLQRFTLFPVTVFHLRVNQGPQKYPLMERPMFFQHEVHIDEIIELKGRPEQVELSLITSANSNWRLSNLSFSAVREHSRYNISFSALIGLWALTLFWGLTKAWRRSPLPTLAVGGLLALVLLGVLSSRGQMLNLFSWFVGVATSIGGKLTKGDFSGLMQFGHIGMFCALTVVALVFRWRWKLNYSQIILGVVVLTIATEALQRHAFGRSPNMQDIIFDSLGIAAGAILYELVYRSANIMRRSD